MPPSPRRGHLPIGESLSGSSAMKTLELVGHRFGRLVVVDRVENDVRNHKSRFVCRCDCGSVVVVLGTNLKSGNSRSCRCLRIERTKQANTKHGHCANGRRSATWVSWQATKQRVLNPRASNFSRFGARGIKVCAAWLGKRGFERFLHDLGERPPNSTLRRLGDVSYEPGSCTWKQPARKPAAKS